MALADNGWITMTAVPGARARVVTLLPFFFAVAELRVVGSAVFPFDFGIGHSSFDFAVEVDSEHRDFGKRTVELRGPVLFVVLAFPRPILRTAAILDVTSHMLLTFNSRRHRVISELEVRGLLGLDPRKVLCSIFAVIGGLLRY